MSLNLKCRSIKGWPRLYLEAWGTDTSDRNNFLGYSLKTIPLINGECHIDFNCWRPKGNMFSNYILGITSEYVDNSIVSSSVEKFSIETVSTGSVIVDLNVILKDFELHGIE